MEATRFPIWKTLRIGGKMKLELVVEMESKGFNIGGSARDMLSNEAFTTLFEPVEIRLVRATLEKLGFKKGAVMKNIWKRVQDLGLTRCPAEVGPHLRLFADVDRSSGEWCWIGMDPITDSSGCPDVFGVGRVCDSRWLLSNGAMPDAIWSPKQQLVLVAPAA